MARMIAILARLMTANPGDTARQVGLTGLVGSIAALFFVTFWAAFVVGLVMLVARHIGVLGAVFAVAGSALVIGLALLIWLSVHWKARRRERLKRSQHQQAILAAGLASLPAMRLNSATLVIAGLVALTVLLEKSNSDPDKED